MTKSKGQKQSKKQEARLAKVFGGKRVASSGAFWNQKGDVRSKELLIEAKWTGKASVTIKAAVLEKIVTEAILDGREPALALSLNGENYIVQTEDDYLETRHKLQEYKCAIESLTAAGKNSVSVTI